MTTVNRAVEILSTVEVPLATGKTPGDWYYLVIDAGSVVAEVFSPSKKVNIPTPLLVGKTYRFVVGRLDQNKAYLASPVDVNITVAALPGEAVVEVPATVNLTIG